MKREHYDISSRYTEYSIMIISDYLSNISTW